MRNVMMVLTKKYEQPIYELAHKNGSKIEWKMQKWNVSEKIIGINTVERRIGTNTRFSANT